MRERKACGVQEWPFQPENGPEIGWHTPAGSAIERIADDRVADPAQVHADLVGASGVDRDLREGDAFQVLHARDARHGRARPPRARRHFLAVYRVASNRRFDAASRLHDAPDQGEVFLLDLPIVELPGERLVGPIVLRHDDQS